ncbi:MAG: hypothetical protein IJY22_04595 [Clostridia bacterium]|nr:hypothetical protein [Clostridia bacterium]
MKNFFRAVGASLLGICLLTFSLWRYDIFPDLSGVTAWLQSAKDQAGDFIQATEDLIDETVNGGGILQLTRPVEDENQYSGYIPTEQISVDLLDLIRNTYDNHVETVDVSSYELTADDLKAIVSSVRYSCPEYFYVANDYNYVKNDQELVTEFRPKYTVDAQTAAQQMVAYEQTIAEIVANGPKEGTDFEKVLYLHDYFVQNYRYDYGYTIRDAYTFFEGKTGVCQAYMLALIATGEAMGLEVLPVTSNAMNHAWNLIKIDGEWYHIDITWDDAESYASYTSYAYFLHSDEHITAFDEAHTKDPAYIHHEWTTSQSAQSTYFDEAVWRESRAPIVTVGDSYYCILSAGAKKTGGALYGGTVPSEMKQILAIDGKWSYQDTNSYYEGCFSGLGRLGDELIYNTDKMLRAYNVKTGQDRFLVNLPLKQYECVYGFHNIDEENRTLIVVAAPTAAEEKPREFVQSMP